MKRIVASVTLAMVLGVVAMLFPILTYIQFTVTTMDRQEGRQGETDSTLTAGEAQGLESTYKAAQTYGRADTGPAPFPSSLFHIMLVIGTGLFAALGVALYFRRKMELVRYLLRF